MVFDDDHLPDGWKVTTLGEIATVVMGASPPSAVVNDHGDGLPFLQGNAEFGSQTPTPTSWCSDPGKRAQPGDILMSVRAPVGETNRADREYCIGRGLAAIRLPSDDRDFGWYALRHGMPQLQRVAQGSTFDAINRDELLKFALLLPTPGERRMIASILSSIDTAIERTRAVIEQVRVVKQALLADLMTNGLPGRHKKFKTVKRIGRIPTEWECKPLLEIASYQNGKAFPSSDYDKGAVKLLRPGNLHPSGRVTWDSKHTTTLPDTYLDSAADWIVGGDELIMNLTAQSLEDEFLGRACWTLPNDGESLLNQRLARFRTSSCALRFLYWTFRGPVFRRHVDRLPQGSKVKHLYNRDIEGFVVPVPNRAEQDRIAMMLDATEERAVREAEALTHLHVVKTALSDALLTGRIRVTKENRK